MNFDKETIIAMLICVAIVIGWGVYSKKVLAEKQKSLEFVSENTAAQQSDNLAKTNTETDKKIKYDEKSDSDTKKIVETPEQSIDSAKIAETKLPEMPSEFIQNDYVRWEIDPINSLIKSVRFEKYLDRMRKENLSFGSEKYNFDALKLFIAKVAYKVLDVEVKKDGKSLIVSRKIKINDSILLAIQTFSVGDGYVINSKLTLRNIGKEELLLKNFAISAGRITNFTHMAGDNIRQEYFSIDSCLAAGNTVSSKPFKSKAFDEIQENPVRWISLSNKYFCSILLPMEVFEEGNTLMIDPSDPNLPLISAAGLRDLKFKADETKEFSYSLYAGPKERKLLKAFDPYALKIMHFGWNWLDPISQLLLSFLVLLNKYVLNYGLSIIILTLLVKLAFWPITEKANSSMKNMQKLQPMVLEIKEKYKNDPQKMNLKVMELYKEHGVNPLGGCFPILLQIPVFFALYNTLSGAIELRQSAFLWAQDLSRPDSLFVPGIPLPINPLALAMTVTMFIQQKMTPSSADPTQQKIMAFMPLIMLFMLYNLPSGLTLYWTVSQIISIIQLLLSQKTSLFSKKAAV